MHTAEIGESRSRKTIHAKVKAAPGLGRHRKAILASNSARRRADYAAAMPRPAPAEAPASRSDHDAHVEAARVSGGAATQTVVLRW